MTPNRRKSFSNFMRGIFTGSSASKDKDSANEKETSARTTRNDSISSVRSVSSSILGGSNRSILTPPSSSTSSATTGVTRDNNNNNNNNSSSSVDVSASITAKEIGEIVRQEGSRGTEEGHEEYKDDDNIETSPSVGSNRSRIHDIPIDSTIKLVGGWASHTLVTLGDIGRNMKALEDNAKRIDIERMEDWESYQKPVYKVQQTELTQSVKETQETLEKEMYKGPEHTKTIEDKLKAFTDVLEDVKKKLYFPSSAYTLGGDGVYIGLDDYWLEYCEGFFEVALYPSSDQDRKELPSVGKHPYILINITGSDPTIGSGGPDGLGGGCAVRLQVDNFKLNGDKGSGVPKLSLEILKVTLNIRLTLLLYYDSNAKVWKCKSGEGLKIKLVSFKGPYGLPRTLVATILTILKPLIRKSIAAAIPPEFGVYLEHMPGPFNTRGCFRLKGIKLEILDKPMAQMEKVIEMTGCSSTQLEMLQILQNHLGRKNVIKTLDELITYVNIERKHGRIWESIVIEWEKALGIYQAAVGEERAKQGLTQVPSFTFLQLVEVAQDIRKKHISIDLKVLRLKGNFDVKKSIEQMHVMMCRLAEEKLKTVDEANRHAFREKLYVGYIKSMQILGTLSQNLDLVNVVSKGGIKTGTDGHFLLSLRDMNLVAPLKLEVPFTKAIHFGYRPIVEYNIIVKPIEKGHLQTDISYYKIPDVDPDDEEAKFEDKGGDIAFLPPSPLYGAGEGIVELKTCKYDHDCIGRIIYKDSGSGNKLCV